TALWRTKGRPKGFGLRGLKMEPLQECKVMRHHADDPVRIRGSRAVSACVLGLAVCLGVDAKPAARAADFAALLRAYRTGDADKAIAELATWSPRQVEGADPHLSPGDVWGRFAAALLMREAAESVPGPSFNATLELDRRSTAAMADLCVAR